MKTDDSDEAITHLFKKYRAEMNHPLPMGLKNKILSRLFSQATEKLSFLSWMSFGGGAVAACLALILAFQFGRISVSGSGEPLLIEEVVSSHVRSLMAQHLSDVISTDQHTVKPWFEGKIDFAPTVKNFIKEGFPLIGGRLDYIAGRPTAALVYKFNQHVINVLQHPAAASEVMGPHLKSVRGFQIFSWTKDGMTYWAVSDVNAVDLQKFVELWL